MNSGFSAVFGGDLKGLSLSNLAKDCKDDHKEWFKTPKHNEAKSLLKVPHLTQGTVQTPR